MMYFRWQGLTSTGEESTSLIAAPSYEAAQLTLMYQGIAVFNLHQTRKQSNQAQQLFFNELIAKLALLTTHGLPLHQALAMLSNQASNAYNKANIASILISIRSGYPFAECLKEQFPNIHPYIPALIKSGEESGKIEHSLTILHEHLEQQTTLKKKIVAAATPPILTLLFSLAIIITLLVAVVPQFERLFSTLEKPMPSGTVTLIAIAHCLQNPFFWLVTALCLAGTLLLHKIIRKNSTLNAWHGRALLHTPYINHLIIKTEFARFLTILGILSDATLPLHHAATIARTSITNTEVAKWIQTVIENLSLGKPLLQCVKEIQNPAGATLADLLAPTSSIGVTRKTLALAIAAYEQEALKSVNRFALLIGPILLLIVGGFIFAILIFLYLPLFNLANSI